MSEVNLEFADRVFDNCQEAIEELCIGCPDERGWALMLGDETGAACRHMVEDLTGCNKPIVMDLDGKPFCAVRYERHEKPFMEKYEKRMRGDWS